MELTKPKNKIKNTKTKNNQIKKKVNKQIDIKRRLTNCYGKQMHIQPNTIMMYIYVYIGEDWLQSVTLKLCSDAFL